MSANPKRCNSTRHNSDGLPHGVFDTMAVDEVAPLLMLPIGLALRHAA